MITKSLHVLVLLLAMPLAAQEKCGPPPPAGENMTCPYAGVKLDKKALDAVKCWHTSWIKLGMQRPRDGSGRARLCLANLSGADLSNAPLFDADLTGADLVGADLRGAFLRSADLTGARLTQADLRGADLQDAILSEANLIKANLSEAKLYSAILGGADLSTAILREARLGGADLSTANLREAILSNADLSEANLSGAKLSGADLVGADLYWANLIMADLSGANLFGANLEEANLSGADLSGVELFNASLTNIVFDNDDTPSGVRRALTELRKEYVESGLRENERYITYLLYHQKTMNQLNRLEIEGLFSYIFFELTTEWGLRPGRALIFLLTLIPIFACPYALAIWTRRRDGIWRIWGDGRVRQDLGGNVPEQVTAGFFKAVGLGLYFSLMSAFHIGWRDFNVGNWISRMQPREYVLQASGWVRTVSGVQSLMSVYLLAIWALTYFGRPFE